MRITSLFKKGISRLISKGYWYNNVLFPGCKKFWNYSTFNTQVINLGSTSAVNAFDYEGLNIKGANFALSQNPLLGDFSILKNYYSYLAPHSTVIISLCPFSSLSGSYDYFDDRYYTILYPSTITHFSYRRSVQVKKMRSNPLAYYPLMALFKDIWRTVFKKHAKQLNEEMMKKDALRWMADWKKEFSIEDFDDPLSLKNQDGIEDAVSIIDSIILFCKKRELRPVLVIPPVYHTLGELFTPGIRELVIDSMINKFNNKDVKFFNYMDDSEFKDDISLFLNSYFLNKKGASKFTKKVLSNLSLI